MPLIGLVNDRKRVMGFELPNSMIRYELTPVGSIYSAGQIPG
jgi:hypothetical protein